MFNYVMELCMVSSGSIMLPLNKAIQVCYHRVCVKLHFQPPAAAIGRKVLLCRRSTGTMEMNEHFSFLLEL